MKTRCTLLKKNCVYYVILCFFLFQITVSTGQIRLTKVNPTNAEVTIHNYGTSMVDISGYFFCAKRSYGALATATVLTGSLNLAAGADVSLVVNTVPTGLSNSASDLSIYINGANFSNATSMVDFMQYGDSFPDLSGRENEAVSQGFWVAGTFIGGEPTVYFYNGTGTENGVDQWDTTLGLNDEILNASLSIYPNPTSDVLNIKKLQSINLNKALIYDITGRLLNAIDLSQTISKKTIQLDKISNGVYFIRISDNQGGIVAKRFIKD